MTKHVVWHGHCTVVPRLASAPFWSGTLRLAFFNATLLSGHDGVTRVLHRTMDGAKRRGVRVMAVGAQVPNEGIDGVRTLRVPSVVMPFNHDYRLALPAPRSFARALDEFGPQLIHVHSPCTLGLAARRYAQRRGIPAVATYHTHFPSYLSYYGLTWARALVWRWLRSFYAGFCRVFVPSTPVLDELRSQGVGRLELLPHGVDTDAFHPRFRSQEWRRAVGASDDDVVVLYVGRLVWEKGLRTLAEAHARLRTTLQRCVTVVVGDGHARAELEGLMPGARFLGYRSGVDLSTAFASADVFAFPSVTETFGNVTVEAMASGVVPVAAAAGGAKTILRHGESGYLAAPHDGADLAAGIEALAREPGRRRRMAEAARATAQNCAWEAVLDRLFGAYAELGRPLLSTSS